ncbi:MAG: hypothetical protein ABI185_00220 [Ginsengibacter sp.]
MNHSSIENFKSGIQIATGTNSEQKVEEMHVTMSYHQWMRMLVAVSFPTFQKVNKIHLECPSLV